MISAGSKIVPAGKCIILNIWIIRFLLLQSTVKYKRVAGVQLAK